MDKTTLYWLFTTIAQTYGAIIAIIGFLMVFRLENMRRIRAELRQRQIDTMVKIFLDIARRWPPSQMIKHYHNLTPEEQQRYDDLESHEKENLYYDIKVIEDAGHYADNLTGKFKPFFAYHLFIIIASFTAIFIIPTAQYWLRRNLPSLNSIFVIALSISLVVIFYASIKLIYSFVHPLLEGLPEREENETTRKEVQS